MAAPVVAQRARDPHMTALHASAITVAVLSGICALAALAAGSPLEFGGALALCGGGWVAADFIAWTVEGERADRPRATFPARIGPAYGSFRVVHTGAGVFAPRKLGRGLSAMTPTAEWPPTKR